MTKLEQIQQEMNTSFLLFAAGLIYRFWDGKILAVFISGYAAASLVLRAYDWYREVRRTEGSSKS